MPLCKRKKSGGLVRHFDVSADNGAFLLLALLVISGVLNVNRFRIYAGLSVITEWKYDAPDSVNNSGLNYANCELPRFPFPLDLSPFHVRPCPLFSLSACVYVRMMHVLRHFIPPRSLQPFATWLITSFAGSGHKNIFHPVRAFATRWNVLRYRFLRCVHVKRIKRGEALACFVVIFKLDLSRGSKLFTLTVTVRFYNDEKDTNYFPNDERKYSLSIIRINIY